MSKPTKYYSSKQEKFIAKYLGWDVVTGSGARDFHPGDTKDFDWLGECKTHTTEQPKILIKRSWWDKIADEAIFVRKTPVLFVDNGNTDNVWVVTYATSPNEVEETLNITVQTNINFALDELDKSKIYKVNLWKYGFNIPRLMSLNKFYEAYIQ